MVSFTALFPKIFSMWHLKQRNVYSPLGQLDDTFVMECSQINSLIQSPEHLTAHSKVQLNF